MFSSDKVKVIEFHPTSCGNVCYWHLSHILGNTHNILPVIYKNDKEFDVELDKLDYTVDKLLNDVFCSENIFFKKVKSKSEYLNIYIIFNINYLKTIQ